jgi:hypothetical protein
VHSVHPVVLRFEEYVGGPLNLAGEEEHGEVEEVAAALVDKVPLAWKYRYLWIFLYGQERDCPNEVISFLPCCAQIVVCS